MKFVFSRLRDIAVWEWEIVTFEHHETCHWPWWKMYTFTFCEVIHWQWSKKTFTFKRENVLTRTLKSWKERRNLHSADYVTTTCFMPWPVSFFRNLLDDLVLPVVHHVFVLTSAFDISNESVFTNYQVISERVLSKITTFTLISKKKVSTRETCNTILWSVLFGNNLTTTVILRIRAIFCPATVLSSMTVSFYASWSPETTTSTTPISHCSTTFKRRRITHNYSSPPEYLPKSSRTMWLVYFQGEGMKENLSSSVNQGTGIQASSRSTMSLEPQCAFKNNWD